MSTEASCWCQKHTQTHTFPISNDTRRINLHSFCLIYLYRSKSASSWLVLANARFIFSAKVFI